MLYIRKTPDESGYYGAPSTSGGGLLLPDDLLNDYLAARGFVELTVSESDTVVAVTPNQDALDRYLAQHPDAPVSPAEQRETAYNTVPAIEWRGKRFTVTEAAQLWNYYAAEGDSGTAAEICFAIAAAKHQIREEFPDEEATE